MTPLQRVGTRRPRADLCLAGLGDETAVRGPEVLEAEDDGLEGGMRHLLLAIREVFWDYGGGLYRELVVLVSRKAMGRSEHNENLNLRNSQMGLLLTYMKCGAPPRMHCSMHLL